MSETFLNMRKSQVFPTETKKENPLTRRVSQINVYAVKRVFQQSSKLKIAKSLIVHVLSSS